MSVITLFRSILIASIVMAILSIVAGESLSQNIVVEQSEPTTFEIIFGLSMLFLLIIATIGLWKTKKWARTLFVITTLAYIIYSPTIGDITMNAWEAMFSDMSIMLEGILIAMMYSGETKNEFELTRNS